MKFHLPSAMLGATLVSSLAVSGWAVAAQTTTELTPEPVDAAPTPTEVTIGEWIFDMPAGQAVAVFPITVNASLDGRFVSYAVAVRHPDGTVSGLTECDNASIICQPSTSEDFGALKSADPGDVFYLAGEAKS